MSGLNATLPDAGEADYFESLLLLERNANQKTALPGPLLDLATFVGTSLNLEGVEFERAKPTLLQRNQVVSFGANPALMVFEQRNPNLHSLIALDQAALIYLAGLLLGFSKAPRNGAPSSTEIQIVSGFFGGVSGKFTRVENPSELISWSALMGAKFPLNESADGPSLLVLANRRDETSQTVSQPKPDLAQQQQIRQVINNGTVDVQYVLNAGQVALDRLRNLKPGSVLPFDSAVSNSVEARANGALVLNGTLRFAEGQLRVGVKNLLAKEAFLP
ncbi:MAG: FliM/FliN family flagellar motor switch protein [Notoacmeibacter sp.]